MTCGNLKGLRFKGLEAPSHILLHQERNDAGRAALLFLAPHQAQQAQEARAEQPRRRR